MAFNQLWIDRYKAQGFYKHVEWNRADSILVKISQLENGSETVTFERGVFDKEYDEKGSNQRQFVLSKKEAVFFMYKIGFSSRKVIEIFRKIEGCQTVKEKIKR